MSKLWNPSKGVTVSPSFTVEDYMKVQSAQNQAVKTNTIASILGGLIGGMYSQYNPAMIGLGAYIGNLIGQGVSSYKYGTEFSFNPFALPNVKLNVKTDPLSKPLYRGYYG